MLSSTPEPIQSKSFQHLSIWCTFGYTFLFLFQQNWSSPKICLPPSLAMVSPLSVKTPPFLYFHPPHFFHAFCLWNFLTFLQKKIFYSYFRNVVEFLHQYLYNVDFIFYMCILSLMFEFQSIFTTS